jgi:hypothetical protein
MMRLSPEEERAITDSKSFIAPCRLYTAAVANRAFELKPDFVGGSGIIPLMLKTIASQVKGEPSYAQGEDWVKKANDHLPAAFSSLFGGWSRSQCCSASPAT